MASKGKQLTSEPAEAKGNRVDYRLEQRRLGFFLGDCCAVVERVTGVVLFVVFAQLNKSIEFHVVIFHGNRYTGI